QAFRDAQLAAEEERKQVEPHIGRLKVTVQGADAAKDLAVAVDGQPFPVVLLGVPQPTDPGEHTVTATAAGFKSAPATVSLKDAGSAAVILKLEPEGSVAPLAGPTTLPTTTQVSLAP